MQMQLFGTEIINVKAMSKGDLINAYGVCRTTLRSWLSKVPNLDQKNKKIFTPAEVKIIYEHLGTP
jgi:hypothetical protein